MVYLMCGLNVNRFIDSGPTNNTTPFMLVGKPVSVVTIWLSLTTFHAVEYVRRWHLALNFLVF